MSVSNHEEKMITLQHQMRQNQSELQSYLADLDNWESEIKQKEEKLKADHTGEKTEKLPPVRNTLERKKLKKKKKEKPPSSDKPKKISGFDFRAWDKFDVDKALEEIDKEDKKDKTSSSEYETDEEWELERKKHLASLEKEKGNECLKRGDYDAAVEAYSKGMALDATNSILPANRAMALLKQQKFAAAELDCTSSISLDPMYIKAYLRRATARSGLGKLKEAIEDYDRVLDLESGNKQAKIEKERLEKEMKREKEGPLKSSYTDTQTGIVKPIYKPPEERSKAPLKAILIEEIGLEAQNRPQPNLEQSEIAKKVTSEEGKKFDKLFTASSSVHSPETSSNSRHSKSQVNGSGSMQNEANSKTSEDVQIHLPMNGDVNDKTTHPDVAKERLSLAPQRISGAPNIDKLESSITPGRGEGEPNAKNKTQQGIHHLNTISTSGRGDGDAVFEIPQTSFQFQSDFKLLRKKPEAFFQYFQLIPPLQYVKLFGQCLDADILNAVIKSLSDNVDKCQDKLYDILLNLTLVKRFSMTAMFLSSKDKLVIKDLIDKLSNSTRCSADELARLRKDFNL